MIIVNNILKKKRRNLSRKSFIRRRPAKKPYYNIRELKEQVATRNYITKPRVATLFIKHKRRNTFLTLSRQVKNNALNKFGQPTNKPQFLVAQAMSIGHLRLYKGRGKSSSVAFKALACV